MFKAIKEFFVGKPAEPVKEVVAEAPYKVETPAEKVEAVNAAPVAKAEPAKKAPAKAPAKTTGARKAPAKKPATAKPAGTKPAPKRKPKK